MYISHKAVIELSVTEVGSRHLIVSSKGVVVDFNIISAPIMLYVSLAEMRQSFIWVTNVCGERRRGGNKMGAYKNTPRRGANPF